jgi:hypothetical protein
MSTLGLHLSAGCGPYHFPYSSRDLRCRAGKLRGIRRVGGNGVSEKFVTSPDASEKGGPAKAADE